MHKSRLLAFKGEHLLVLEKIGLKKQYTFPGGIQKKRETDCDALIREVEEEIDLQLNRKDLTYFISRRNITKDKREVYKHYFVTTKDIENIDLLEPEKFKRALWIPWYQALEYLDKEDRSAVILYCEQFNEIN